jgi:hypothetical protein
MKKPLNRPELQDMHSVLRRSLERAERWKAAHPDEPQADVHAEQLALAVADLDDELTRVG